MALSFPGGEVEAQSPDAGPSAFDVPRMPDVVIDGDASDWGDGGLRVDWLAAADGSSLASGDLDARLRLGWTDQGLLILATVSDDIPVEADAADQLWQHDSLEVFLAEGWGARRYYQVLVGSGADPRQDRPRHAFNPRTLVLEKIPDFTIDLASQVNTAPGVAVIEMLLPWSNLKLQRGVGDEVAMQVFVNDSDDPTGAGGKDRLVWFPSEASDNDTTLMVRLRLTESASAPVRLRAEADYDAEGMVAVAVSTSGDLAGRTIRLVDGKKTLAEGVLEADGSRSGLLLRLAPGGEGRPLGELRVVLDGSGTEPEETQAVYARPQGLELVLDETGGVRARLRSTDAALPGVEVVIEAAAAGRDPVVLRGQVGAKLPLPVEAGVYLVKAQAVDAFGRPLADEDVALVGVDADEAMADVGRRLAGPAFDACRGWIDCLIERVRYTPGPTGRHVSEREALRDLLVWAQRIAADPRLLEGLRGLHEWAYLSKVDGSGQPFAIYVPEDYDPSRPWPLYVFLHGSRGTHSYWSPSAAEMANGAIHVAALGRSRTSSWEGLGEVDVLEMIQYVKAHWRIDADRVHLLGSSMGGGGTFELAARHPDLFASAHPRAGYGQHVPVENLRHVPLYAIHSRDDATVPAAQARLAVRRMARLGGRAVMDMTEGFGHWIEGFTQGQERALAWSANLRRPAAVREVQYTATDELASGAYWTRVIEWGPREGPASIAARVDEGNHLYLDLENVTTARLELAGAPVDRSRPLTVYVNAQVAATVSQPLPEALYVTHLGTDRDGQLWEVSSESPPMPAHRLRFPGGPMSLYHGEGLMFVWGTGGDEATTAALRAIVEAARRYPVPGWSGDDRDDQGRWLFKSWHGPLPAKADVDVTDADMDSYNLVLLGTAEQNRVVARLAGGLPVRIESGEIHCDDGVSWSFTDRAMSLVYYNPLAPARLIHWVAADDVAFYQPGRAVPFDGYVWGQTPDLAIGRASAQQAVGARQFDSRWRWEADYADSPLLTEAQSTHGGQAAILGEALRRAVDADYAIVGGRGAADELEWSAGVSRWADVIALPRARHVMVCTLGGDELRAVAAALAREDPKRACRFVPAFEAATTDAGRRYRVVVSADDLWSFSQQTQLDPPDARLVDLCVNNAILRASARDGRPASASLNHERGE